MMHSIKFHLSKLLGKGPGKIYHSEIVWTVLGSYLLSQMTNCIDPSHNMQIWKVVNYYHSQYFKGDYLTCCCQVWMFCLPGNCNAESSPQYSLCFCPHCPGRPQSCQIVTSQCRTLPHSSPETSGLDTSHHWTLGMMNSYNTSFMYLK